ncbi:TolC family outer membrane protein [Aquabacterium sp.]|uniref:TolC family outer membrane protein n=1 Tax=Aquabacterium sp. TaxID=1872578 RepID=UPI0025BDDDF3|nr:TolC family outer membrane protein [Aquabacterium sp.]MDQ5926926.1 outer membrane protein adhesin transport system [Pseudomonadota bacterium]
MNKRTIKLSLSAVSLAILSVAVQAQSTQTTGLAAAVQQAINQNPEVTARLNALRAAGNEVEVARGQYLPSVDLSASVGRDNDRITSRSPASQSLSRTGLALSASQILWNGMATTKEVTRLDHARLTRYFEFLGTTEETALEATRAYLDVERYRKLVSLAEDNYVQHKYAFNQLQTKFKAGVGRGVDAEQANARLALAESNLTTEQANLHDVSTRYLRIVGDVPAASTDNGGADLSKGIPPSNLETIQQALAKHPSISAAVENMRAAQAQAQGVESSYQPTVEARLRTGVGNNFDGVQDQKRDSSAEIVLNWNLFNGGSDKARVRQYADLLNQAADQRDRACRDVRQTVAIAHNDIRKLQDQLLALDRNVLAIEKARDAYRQQFDIGQRSLLDLLNAENELYTAKRSYANAEFDLQLAYARTQAARYSLTTTLGLAPAADDTQDLPQDWQAADDAAQRCPVTAVDVKAISLSDLDARARKLSVPVMAAAPVAVAPSAPAPAASPAVATVQQRLRDWADAWMAKDVDGYLGFYAKDFAPSRSTRAKWTQERRRLVSKTGTIELTLDNIQSQAQGDAVVTRFDQKYTSSNFQDRSVKVLTWKQIDGKWVIVKESNR